MTFLILVCHPKILSGPPMATPMKFFCRRPCPLNPELLQFLCLLILGKEEIKIGYSASRLLPINVIITTLPLTSVHHHIYYYHHRKL